MSDNLRASEVTDLGVGVLAGRVRELQSAATRGLPPGFRWVVERNPDGTAKLGVVDVRRDAKLWIGAW